MYADTNVHIDTSSPYHLTFGTRWLIYTHADKYSPYRHWDHIHPSKPHRRCNWVRPILLSVAGCCSVLQCVAVCCRVLQGQCVALCCSVSVYLTSTSRVVCSSVLQCVAVCCSVLYRVGITHIDTPCYMLQCVAVCCRALQSIAKYCGMLQCSAVQLSSSKSTMVFGHTAKCHRKPVLI